MEKINIAASSSVDFFLDKEFSLNFLTKDGFRFLE